MEVQKKVKRTMPLWVGLLCVAVAISSLAFSVLAYLQQYSVYLPGITELTFSSPDLRVETLAFTYNTTSKRYDDVVVDVKNYDTPAHVGTLDVRLYSGGGATIASGSSGTGSIAGGVTVAVTVTLTWTGAYTVANLTVGDIQLLQTS